MIFFPDETLSDGLAEGESNGFFDVFNLPPFDTWVTFFEDRTSEHSHQSQLLCYVPAPAIPLADAGMEVNPEECILWLEQTPGPTKALIAELLGQQW